MSIDHRLLFEAGVAVDRRLPKGAAFFRAGDPSKNIALVREGIVHLLRMTPAGAAVILQVAKPSDVLAEASAYSRVHHCSAVVVQPALISVLSTVTFRQGLRDNPALAEAWSAHLAQSVQAARMLAEIRTLRTVAERLDAWLGMGGGLPPKGMRQGLADELGVSREALYRELARRR